MKKRNNSFILVLFVLFMLMVTPVSAVSLFSETFGNGTDWTTAIPDWDKSSTETSGRDDQLSRTGGSDGNYYAWIIGDGEWIRYDGISAVSYQNIQLSYYYNLHGDFAADAFLIVEWSVSGADSWNLIAKTTNIPGWNSLGWDISGAEGETIDIRFSADGLVSGDYIFLDDISIIGDGESISTYCGDGIPQQPNDQLKGGLLNDGYEECDDGNLINDDDDCDNNCVSNIAVVCGDGDVEGAEECEYPDTIYNDDCSQTTTDCNGPKQGTRDGYGDCDSECGCDYDDFADYQCSQACGATCEIDADCDDLDSDTLDICDLDICSCVYVPITVCGNGVQELGEECDDGDIDDGDGCSSQCVIEFCGDQIVNNVDEDCDDGNSYNHDDCLNTCEDATCGDGYVWVTECVEGECEECDDNDNEDGCDSECNFEGGEQCFAPVDVMLVIDTSTSMLIEEEVGITRLDNAQSAANTFIGLLDNSKDQVGLASFSTEATLNHGLTFTHSSVVSAVSSLVASGRTNIGEGIKKAQDEIDADGRNDVNHVIILLSDGAPNEWGDPHTACFPYNGTSTDCTDYAVDQATLAKNDGTEIFVIGLGVNTVTEALLKQLATDPVDNYFSAADSGDLEEIYGKIAEEFCPCDGFDCTINSDNCNVGSCNEESDECEFEPRVESTSCGADDSECTIDHCDGEGSCVNLDNVDCSHLDNQCQVGVCDAGDGECYPNYDNYPLSTSCEADSDLCTIDHCDGFGDCVKESDVDCSQLDDQCQDGECNPSTGACYADYSSYPLSTSCEADFNLCTNDHCDASGNCVKNYDTDCSYLDDQCQVGVCDQGDGECYPNYDNYPLSTPCEADSNLCTNDHCDASGNCVKNYDTDCSYLDGQCQDGVCNQNDGQCYPDYASYPWSTLCSTDDNECTIEHCNALGSCVINEEAELPDECLATFIDSKVAQAMPTSNFGLGRYMIVNPKTPGIDRAYIGIDVSHLSQALNTADLEIAVYYTGSNVINTDIEAWYCPDHPFIETTINWNNQPMDGDCTLADTYHINSKVVAGIPETWHTFNLLAVTNSEIDTGDGLFTIVLKSVNEGTVSDNSEYVQYLTKDYSEEDYQPKFVIT